MNNIWCKAILWFVELWVITLRVVWWVCLIRFVRVLGVLVCRYCVEVRVIGGKHHGGKVEVKLVAGGVYGEIDS